LDGDKKAFIDNVRKALYASKIVQLHPRLHVDAGSCPEYKWDLNYGGVAMMWRGGCIIRSQFLGKIKDAYDNNSQINNLMLDPFSRMR
jgi:6-phosphogluconate dehydrogenase